VAGADSAEAAVTALFDAARSGNCPRTRELGPGFLPDPDDCTELSDMRDANVTIGKVEDSGDGTATVSVSYDGDAAKIHAVDTAAGWFAVSGEVDRDVRGATPEEAAEDAIVATFDSEDDVLESTKEVSNDGFRSIVAATGSGEQFSVIVLRTGDDEWMPAAFVAYDVS
jgi:hypothetical protein